MIQQLGQKTVVTLEASWVEQHVGQAVWDQAVGDQADGDQAVWDQVVGDQAVWELLDLELFA